MAKSARLDEQLQEELEKAAKALGVSQSELIRDAIARRCREVLGETLAERVGPVIGTIESKGGRARDTHAAFQKILRAKRAKRR